MPKPSRPRRAADANEVKTHFESKSISVGEMAGHSKMNNAMESFRHLLKQNTPLCWSPSLQEKSEEAEKMIIKAVTEGVECFKRNRQTCLATDRSNSGLLQYCH